MHILLKRKTQILAFSLAAFCTVAISTFAIKPTYEPKAHNLVKVGSVSRYVPAIDCRIPVISSTHEEQIHSEIVILKGRFLIQDVVTSLGPATIHPDLDVKKNGIPASVIPVRSRQNKTPAQKAALLVRQKKLEVQGIKLCTFCTNGLQFFT